MFILLSINQIKLKNFDYSKSKRHILFRTTSNMPVATGEKNYGHPSTRSCGANAASERHSPSQTVRPLQNQIRTEWKGIASTAPLSRSLMHPVPPPPPVPKSTKHFKCNITDMKKLCSAASQKYVVQHRKICTATSKNMYCNNENYVLQHQKLCTATSQTVVLQHRKINHEIWKMKTFENHLLQQLKNRIATFENHLLQHPKKLIATRRNKKGRTNRKGMGSRCRLAHHLRARRREEGIGPQSSSES
jgi:hypothetical protein